MVSNSIESIEIHDLVSYTIPKCQPHKGGERTIPTGYPCLRVTVSSLTGSRLKTNSKRLTITINLDIT